MTARLPLTAKKAYHLVHEILQIGFFDYDFFGGSGGAFQEAVTDTFGAAREGEGVEEVEEEGGGGQTGAFTEPTELEFRSTACFHIDINTACDFFASTTL